MSTATTQQASGSAWFSKLVVVLLLALAIGLYLRVVMAPGEHVDVDRAMQPWASVQITEATVPGAAAAPLQPLPPDQMGLIREVFAPELAD